jgi:hypothetical protein
MAGEVPKDVVIRVRTEFVKAPAPDLGPVVKAAQDAGKQAQSAAQQAVSQVTAATQASASKVAAAMSAAANAVGGSVAQQVGALRQLIGSMEKESEERKKLQAGLTQVIAMREREAAAINRSAAAHERFKQISIAEKVAAFQRGKQEDSAEAMMEAERATLRAQSAMRGLGEATMTVVRGFALIGASSEKDVQKIMHTLLQVQGAIDLYKGLTGIVLELGQAHRALAAASAASAAAQAASGAAGARGAAAGASGAAAGLGLARFQPHAAAILAGLGVGYGINKFFDLSGDTADENARNLAFQNRGDREDQAGEFLRNRAFGQAAGFGTRNQQIGLGGRFRSSTGQLGLFEQQARTAAGFVGQAGQPGSNREDTLTAQKAARDLQATAEKNVLDALEKQVQLRQRQLDKQKQSVQVAKEALDAEKDRNSSIYASLGGMNAGEQAQLRILNDKAKNGGELNKWELDFIQS